MGTIKLNRYHPFYITDDPEGGYQYKSTEERNVTKYNIKINLSPKLN